MRSKEQFELVDMETLLDASAIPQQRLAEAYEDPEIVVTEENDRYLSDAEVALIDDVLYDACHKAYVKLHNQYTMFSAAGKERFLFGIQLRSVIKLVESTSLTFDQARQELDYAMDSVLGSVVAEKLLAGEDPDPGQSLTLLDTLTFSDNAKDYLTDTVLAHLSKAVATGDIAQQQLLATIAEKTFGSISFEIVPVADAESAGYDPADRTARIKVTVDRPTQTRKHAYTTKLIAVSVAASSVLMPTNPHGGSLQKPSIERLLDGDRSSAEQGSALLVNASKADLSKLIEATADDPVAKALLTEALMPSADKDPAVTSKILSNLNQLLAPTNLAPRADDNALFFTEVANYTVNHKPDLPAEHQAAAKSYAELLKLAARYPTVFPSELKDIIETPDPTTIEGYFIKQVMTAMETYAGSALASYGDQAPLIAGLYAGMWSVATPSVEAKNQILTEMGMPLMDQSLTDQQLPPEVETPPAEVAPAPTELSAEQIAHIDALEISGEQKEFMKQITLALLKIKFTGAQVNYQTVAAQAIHESNWGRSRLAQEGYNFFGMKATDEWTGPTIDILSGEHRNGRDTQEVSKFKKYDSFEASLLDHVNRITNAEHYADASRNFADAGLYIDGLLNKLNPDNSIAIGQGQEGAMSYALDPAYKEKILKTIASYDLDKLMAGQPAAPTPPPAEIQPSPEHSDSPGEALSLSEQISWLAERMTVSAEGYRSFSINRQHMGVFDKFGDGASKPEFMVMHWTGTPNVISSVEAFISSISSAEKSVQYYIDKDGSTFQLMEDNQKARQAKGFNSISAGVEINANAIGGVNGYTPAEMTSMVYMTYKFQLENGLPIGRESVFGHSEETEAGKIDPPKEVVDMIGEQITKLHIALQTPPVTMPPQNQPEPPQNQPTPPPQDQDKDKDQDKEKEQDENKGEAEVVKELASKIMGSGNITFDNSPSDRVRKSMEDLRDDGKTFTKINQDDKKEIPVSPRLLTAVLELSDVANIPIQINCLTTGHDDSPKSSHRLGEGLDLGILSDELAQQTFKYLYDNRERLGVDELIYSGAIPEGTYNLDRGQHHDYDQSTLNGHRNHIHLRIK